MVLLIKIERLDIKIEKQTDWDGGCREGMVMVP